MSRLVPWVLLLGLCAPASVAAQDSPDVPAHIAFIDGAATLERDGRSESAPASMPLLAGDRIRTQNGRVEILFADSSTLHLDANTLVDFQSDEVVRLLTGRVRLNIIHQAGSSRRVAYRVDAPSAWVEIVASGEYKISVIGGERDAEIELAVLRGSADLVNEDGRSSLRAGERAFARAGVAPSAAYVFNSASWDAFDRWSESRRETRLGVSAQYLPETVQSYASTFNDYGYWNYMPTYGYVWYPRVRPGWRPYYYGSWRTLRPWGWTWIGTDPWAWPTHHFGRWGFSAGLWFWIPGRHWGPAWVSWAYAPGYVSWCPLGWNNRPVAFFGSGFRHNPWHAWTVVPHRGFGRGFVNVNVVNATHIDARTRSSFVVRDTSPDVRGYAVPRASAPIRVAGTRGGSIDGGSEDRLRLERGPRRPPQTMPRRRFAAADRAERRRADRPFRHPLASHASARPWPSRTGRVHAATAGRRRLPAGSRAPNAAPCRATTT
jgi:FecR protein